MAPACALGPCVTDPVFTFDNRTDQALCDNTSRETASGRECLATIPARGKKKWERDCDGLKSRQVTIIISVKETGRIVYERTASCGEWAGANRTFIIEERNGELRVFN